MPDLDFQECAACAAKPGAPVLCPACLHNRDVIYALQKMLEMARAEAEAWKACFEIYAKEQA